MLKLPQVTLIALTNRDFEGHKKAIDESCKGIEFGDVKLIWDEKIKDIDDWSRKIVYELGDYVRTDYLLLIHADGYVINPELWRDEWLLYDYVGSPFPLPRDDFSYRDNRGVIQRVGNSVSLRSKRLATLASRLGLEWKSYHGFYNEDGFICVNNRHIYEQNGMKFAPFEEALLFGKEHELPENKDLKTFVFHQV